MVKPQPDEKMIYQFSAKDGLTGWTVVNDGVMGGVSSGSLSVNKEGHGIFEGQIRLENNGGFSSVRLPFNPIVVDGYQKLHIRLKGDGKRYQLRVKSDRGDYQSYITYIQTSGKWEVLTIDLDQFYPSFRGRRLRMPNYPAQRMEEVGVLFGNKKIETFRLEIDYISLGK